LGREDFWRVRGKGLINKIPEIIFGTYERR
jgi:hypothetical protein